MVYGELGRYSLDITIKCRVVSFWAKLAFVNSEKYSKIMYAIVRSMYNRNILKTKWLCNVKNILDECGLSYIWDVSDSIDIKWLVLKVKQMLKDQFMQEGQRQLAVKQ